MTDSVEMFDINSWKWKEMKKLPTPRALATSIVVHDGILLLGQ
jgi:N-acetylneuraminic acid mutarotase